VVAIDVSSRTPTELLHPMQEAPRVFWCWHRWRARSA